MRGISNRELVTRAAPVPDGRPVNKRNGVTVVGKKLHSKGIRKYNW